MPKTFLFFLFFLITAQAWAANPILYYSDLQAGPGTGGQNNLGVFVTVWGNNFGASQGSSTVTVGGGAVANIQTWTNTEVCFQLGGSAVTGNIVLTTSAGASNGLAFTVQSGNIYFVQPGVATNGTGTYASPFQHIAGAYAVMVAGDTVYVEAGTIYDEVNGQSGWHSIVALANSGTQAKPMAYIAYPGATVTLKCDSGTQTYPSGSDSISHVFRSSGGSWITISKFNSYIPSGQFASVTNYDGYRIVGNTIVDDNWTNGVIEIGGNYVYALGNTIQNSGTGMSYDNEAHGVYWNAGGNPGEIGWNTFYNNKNMGWSIDLFHQGTAGEPTRIGKVHDNSILNPNSYQMKGILVGDVDNGETLSDVYLQNIQVYNNLLFNPGAGAATGAAFQFWAGTAYFYNNTIYGALDTDGAIQLPTCANCGPSGGLPVLYMADNIVDIPQSSTAYITGSSGNAPNWSEFNTLTNNDYYGQGNGPSQDSSPVNADPKLVNPGTDYHLQATSPDIAAGSNTNSVVATDYDGVTRPNPPAIGRYEYVAASGGGGGPTLSVISGNLKLIGNLKLNL